MKNNRILMGLGVVFIVSLIGGWVLAGDVIINAVSGEVNASTLNAPTGGPVTVLVAATDSSTISKAHSNYQCDGVDDDVQIQLAYDSLPSTGGSITLMEGSYVINSTIIINNSDIIFAGSSPQTQIKLADGATCDMFTIGPASRPEFVVFQDLYLWGNNGAVSATCHGINITRVRNLYFDRVYLWSFSGNAVHIRPHDESVHDIHFTDVVVENCNGSGFYFESNGTMKVERVFITAGYSYANLRGMHLNGTNVDQIQVANYDFEYNDKEGILIEGGDANTFTGGHITTNSQSASDTYSGVNIKKDADNYGATDNVFSGINFYSGRIETQKYAIYFDTETYANRVSGCQVWEGYATEPYGAYHIAGFARNIIEDINTVAYMKNNNDASMTEGDIVIFDTSDSTGLGIINTTTKNDTLVYGVAAYSISAGDIGRVITEGLTWKLHVNGIDDIAVGDFICTYNESGVGVKCSSGDGYAIAIALAAYTTNDSSGAIAARVISPR